jgi:hypothetical protein
MGAASLLRRFDARSSGVPEDFPFPQESRHCGAPALTADLRTARGIDLGRQKTKRSPPNERFKASDTATPTCGPLETKQSAAAILTVIVTKGRGSCVFRSPSPVSRTTSVAWRSDQQHEGFHTALSARLFHGLPNDDQHLTSHFIQTSFDSLSPKRAPGPHMTLVKSLSSS